MTEILQNVTLVNKQMGKKFKFAAWHSNVIDGDPPQLLGTFYGAVMAADFVGNAGDLTVLELDQPKGNKNISAYAGFHDGKLAKVALTNQELYLSGPRPNATVPINLKALGTELPSQVKAQKLWGPSGDALEDLTWAGTDWSYNETTGEALPVQARNYNSDTVSGGWEGRGNT